MERAPYCSREGDYSNDRPKIRFARGGRLLQLSFAQSPAQEWNAEMFFDRSKPRSSCKGFSRGSRRRLMNHLNTLRTDAPLPLFVTLTLPDDCYVPSITEFAKVAKSLLDVWLKRLGRICPSASGFWRIEWQTRKSGPLEGKVFPHFHLMLWGVEYREKVGSLARDGGAVREAFVRVRDPQLNLSLFETLKDAAARKGEARAGSDDSARKCQQTAVGVGVSLTGRGSGKLLDRLLVQKVKVENPSAFGEGYDAAFMSFFDWASLSWYHVVGSHNPDHFLAGVSCEVVRSWGGVMSYCSKYLAKLGDWEFMTNVELGRQWGVFNRALIPWAEVVEMPLDGEVGVRLRRVCRRYLEKVTGRRRSYPFGLTLYCDTGFVSSLLGPPPDPF